MKQRRPQNPKQWQPKKYKEKQIKSLKSVDKAKKPKYKYTVTLKPINDELDPGAIPGISTINTFTECAYDGDDQDRQA